MKCLIVAAGQGSRLREKGSSKPLVPLAGRPLIEHVVSRAREGGATEFVVVDGWNGDALRAALDPVAERDGFRLTWLRNERWDRANGVSVLRAREVLDGPFLLCMCDHVVDPGIVRTLIDAPAPAADTVTLGVDFDLRRPLNDPDDVTRVACEDNRITRIGKSIERFDALDTGVFRCSPAMFDALDSAAVEGDDSISGAMNVLARWRRAYVADIGARYWIDVDDAVAHEKAEALLARGLL
ncbi:MAG: NTP transferase domain-containing protein [Gluconacetobacter diazotrophicus]|nr:NTP transferase domain-containing protein [Gluconacetobacter diazotrophicus]